MIKQLLTHLKYSNIKNMSYDNPEIMPLMHYNVKNHGFVRRVYEDFYKIFMNAAKGVPDGKLVELGTGYGFLKEFSYLDLICSDINTNFNVDLRFSAEYLPLKENTVSAFFMIGVLHHIKNVDMFFSDVKKVLVPGGKVVMIEPFNSPFARAMYRISHHEPFDLESGWKISGDKHLADANIALPWIIFFRDRKIFESKYPNLRIKKIETHNPITFQLSGAGAFNTFLPGCSFPFFKAIELLLKPLYNYLAMWMTIELENVGS